MKQVRSAGVRRAGVCGVAVLLLAVGCREPERPRIEDRLQAALDGVSAGQIQLHVQTLADDAMQGRGTGTEGYDRAAQYVAEQFAAIGLEPAGDAHGFFQQVPLQRADLDPELTVVELRRDRRRRKLEPGRHLAVQPDVARERADLTAGIVFVGHGVSAPDRGHDDYAGLDVRGKIVVALRGAPDGLAAHERAHHALPWVKRQRAIDHGAVGLLTLRGPEDEDRQPWEALVTRLGNGETRWLEEGGRPHDAFGELFFQGVLGRPGAETLFEGAVRSLDEALAAATSSRPAGFELPGELDVSTRTRHVPVRSANVLGWLRGSDPALADELLVLTAHLDHLGVGVAVDDDTIYNGAHDNASGVAVMLEVARALSTLQPAPRRGVVFAAVTGEERGLLGSDYLAAHPAALPGTVVANLNLDMVMMLDPPEAVVAYGIEHSSLAEPAGLAAAQLGLEIVPDPVPQRTVFLRSDHYSFVRRGVPALMLSNAPGPGFDAFLRGTYHTPADDLSQPMDFEIGALFARLHVLAAAHVADAGTRPVWNPGDFFGTAAARP